MQKRKEARGEEKREREEKRGERRNDARTADVQEEKRKKQTREDAVTKRTERILPTNERTVARFE